MNDICVQEVKKETKRGTAKETTDDANDMNCSKFNHTAIKLI